MVPSGALAGATFRANREGMSLQAAIRVQELCGYEARYGRAVTLVYFENRSTETRIVEISVREHRVVDRFPEIRLSARGHPVAIEGPRFYQVLALPGEFVLMPGLGGIGSDGVRAGFRFHVDIVSLDQRDLIVGEQIATIVRLLVGHERVVDDVRQDLVKVLADDVQKSRVLGILHPLRPAISESCGESEGHTA